MINLINKIEKKYDVAKITAGRFQVWPFLRWTYYFSFIDVYAGKKTSQEPTFWKKIVLLGNFFYGFRNWFRRYDIIVFSNTSELKLINGTYINKLTGPLFTILKNQKILYVEVPAPYHYPIKSLSFKKIVSIIPLKFLKKLAQLFLVKKDVIQHKEILDNIKNEYNLHINDYAVINSFLREYSVYKILFRIMKPKAVFTTDHSLIAVRKAASDLGIVNIEIQHGTIGEAHPAYHSNTPLDESFYPDYLLVFGNHDQESLKSSSIYKKTKIILIGSYYIDLIYNSDFKINKLNNLKSDYQKSIGVSLQWTVEDEVIRFVIDAASINEKILYVLIPRPKDQTDFSKYSFPKNVIVYKDYDFYRTIKNLDFHSTAYSTCALEAPSLGIQNILIDIGGLARKCFENVLVDREITRFVETPEEFVNTIVSFEKKDLKEIRTCNSKNFAPDCTDNIVSFLKTNNFL